MKNEVRSITYGIHPEAFGEGASIGAVDNAEFRINVGFDANNNIVRADVERVSLKDEEIKRLDQDISYLRDEMERLERRKAKLMEPEK